MIRIGYVKVESNGQTGIVTIALRCPEEGKKKYAIEFAFCSPKDFFVKKEGRVKALGRLVGRTNILKFKFDGKYRDAMIHGLTLAAQEGRTPRWLNSALADPDAKFIFGLRDSQKNHLLKISFVESKPNISKIVDIAV